MGKRRRVIVIRHGDDPPDDRVHVHLHRAGYLIDTAQPFAGGKVPAIDDTVAGVVVHGGGFDAYDHDRHPFLAEEARLIEACLAADLPLLGICQGAQQIAGVLGAPVGPAAHGMAEFGYYEIAPAPGAGDFLARPLVVAQAHYHEFGVPAGARKLAASALFGQQAFAYGKALALQFHPEVTIEGFRRWQAAPWALFDHPGAQSRDEQDRLMAEHDAAQAEWFYGLLGRLFPKQEVIT